VRDAIIQKLLDMEAREGIRLLYACESGSRAWGFASPDSDYDVRFIYARPTEWYLSVFPGRDVIELPVEGDLDINGWDIRKALELLRKSNPAPLEWLDSPIVYHQRPAALGPLVDLAAKAYNPLASVHHYLSMASHQRTILVSAGGVVRRKKYFYLLRALLAARWSLQHSGQPPMEFSKLLAASAAPEAVACEIEELLRLKLAGSELDGGERSALLDGYVEALRSEIEAQLPPPQSPPPVTQFDAALRETLRLAWARD
jgi:predicted nucleotidyltransferase